MTGLPRRSFVGTALGTALGVAAGVGTTGSGTAWATSGTASAAPNTAWAAPGAEGHAAGGSYKDVHESAVRAAAMRWRALPANWREGPFLANGFLGCQVYRGERPGTLTVMISHTQAQDERGRWRAGTGYARLPIGYFTLTLAGEITAVDWTLDLWDAELRGTVTTTRGSLRFAALVHNSRSTLLISTRPSPGEEAAAWTFTWLTAATTRNTDDRTGYTPNPDPRLGTAGATHYAEQPLLAGGGWTTAWRERRTGTGRLFAAHLAHRFPGDTAQTTRRAVREVADALAADPDDLTTSHRAWWHRYFRRSFLSVPDKRLQSFYLIQLYKLASATRAEGPALSEWGPWFPAVGNNWTALWWNLNVQIASWPMYGSNHLELDSVTGAFRRFEKNLELSVPEEYRDGRSYALGHPSDWQLRPGAWTVGVPGTDHISDNFGNLTWALHNVWLAYRHSMDRRALRDVLFPILAKAVNYYARFLHEGPDGKLHLPMTRSPEYANAADCTYDLSLIRWGAATLLRSARLLRIPDPRAKQWRAIAERLVPYARDPEDGVLIGAGVPLAGSHRHFSHLLWLYPLREAVWERRADRAVMRATFDHWTSMRDAWHGYSFAAASSMCSVMDAPEQALDFLTFFTDRNVVADTELLPNTMYREGKNFALETPLTAAQSLLDMAVQSHGGVVKVFPSVSERWADASFASLRAQGAFLVDADRSRGRTRWVRVHSEAGSPLVLDHGMRGDLDVRHEDGRRARWRRVGAGRIAVELRRGETVLVGEHGSRVRPGPRDVPANGGSAPWGLPG
ncbi:glycoside hydrolase family 95-like protein [Streptomyces sp. NPDC050617]|uniref:glycosyl hydrolase family 95 catalytic domain-containing protein n=1 Tax=Streptomyces sp. NPDC050617 TaxID=3154628 RepID=UPI00343A495F